MREDFKVCFRSDQLITKLFLLPTVRGAAGFRHLSDERPLQFSGIHGPQFIYFVHANLLCKVSSMVSDAFLLVNIHEVFMMEEV